MTVAGTSAQTTATDIYRLDGLVHSTADRKIILDSYEQVINYRDSIRSIRSNVNQLAHAHIVASHMEYKLGDLQGSEASAIRALEIIEKQPESDWKKDFLPSVYNQLGRVNERQLRFSQAVEHYKKLLEIVSGSKQKATILNNIGHSYTEMQSYQNAINAFQQGLELFSFNEYPKLHLKLLSNLGRAQSYLGRLKAEETLLNVLQLRDSLGYTSSLTTSHLHLSEHYLRNNKLEQAEFHAQNALNISKRNGLVTEELASLKQNLSLGDDNIATRFAYLTDSLNTENLITSNKYAEFKYNVAKKEEEAEQLRQRSRLYIIIGVLTTAFLIALGTIGFLRMRQRNRLAVIKEGIATENRIAVKIHDELANDMFTLMVQAQEKNIEANQLLEQMDDLYLRLRDISSEHAALDQHEDFGMQLDELLSSYQTVDTNVVTQNLKYVDWSEVLAQKKNVLYRTLQELLINSKKHAQASLIYLTISQDGEIISGTYSDNGKGASELKIENGLTNMEIRILALNGTINFETSNGNGFKASFKF